MKDSLQQSCMVGCIVSRGEIYECHSCDFCFNLKPSFMYCVENLGYIIFAGPEIRLLQYKQGLYYCRQSVVSVVSFCGRWRKNYNPDLIFVSENVAHQCLKSVGMPVPSPQRQPVLCEITAAVLPQVVKFQRRYNLKKG